MHTLPLMRPHTHIVLHYIHTMCKRTLQTEINSSAKNLSPMAYCRDKLSDFDIELLLIECFWVLHLFHAVSQVNLWPQFVVVASHLSTTSMIPFRLFYLLLYIYSLCFIISWLVGCFVVFLFFSSLLLIVFFFLFLFQFFFASILMTSRYKCV